MFVVVECFLLTVVKDYGKHPVAIDEDTGYSQAYRFLNLKHHTHSSYEKSTIERTYQNIMLGSIY
jgi:hypothetical protein